jgi:hypothetical protein
MLESIIIILAFVILLGPKILASLSFSPLWEIILAATSRFWQLMTRERGCKLAGFIFELDSEAPLPDAKVEVRSIDQISRPIKQIGYSNSFGKFAFNCPAGDYKIHIAKPGYSMAVLAPKKLLSIPQAVYSGKTITLSSPAKTMLQLPIFLKQINRQFERDRSRTVLALERIIRLLTILLLPLVALVLVVNMTDLYYQFNWITLTKVCLYLFVGFLTVSRLMIPVIRGVVVDLETRKALPSSIVRAYKNVLLDGRNVLELMTATTTDSSGRFKMNLEPGKYQIFTSHHGHQTMKADRLVVPPEYGEIRITIFLIHQLTASHVAKQTIRFVKS